MIHPVSNLKLKRIYGTMDYGQLDQMPSDACVEFTVTLSSLGHFWLLNGDIFSK
jgi:hypothetical protein